MTLLFEFNHPALIDSEIAGGKGANLAKLTQAGFPVPPGFVLTPDAYRAFISFDPAFARHVEELPLDDPAALEQSCQSLCLQMAKWPLPSNLRGDIANKLMQFDNHSAFSVRSSATAEDLGAAAFAGQHETYLNCSGLDNIVARIRDCWISLWSARAVSYRIQAGIAVMDTAMAVVVQSMVFSRVSGVGFCINPITGNSKEQSVDANYGLGESVVGGEYAVDHWILNKVDASVKETVIANKTLNIIADASGTREAQVDAAKVDVPCLNHQELIQLSQLMSQVEKFYAYPQDIEWAIADSKLWLLQSRPITRISPRWTRDESAERFPSVITPLAWDLVEQGFHQSLAYSFRLMGLPPYQGKWFALFDSYVYGNQNAVEIYAEGSASALNVRSVEEFISALPLLRKRYAWVQDLPLTWSRDLDRYLLRLGELNAESLQDKSIAQRWEYVMRVKQLGADYFLPNIAISITQRTLYKLVYSIVETALGKAAAPGCFDRLLAYCETKTGFINKELYRLARKISQRASLAEKMRNMNGKEFLQTGGFNSESEILGEFEMFLLDHGHREVEFDPYHATWVEAPWLVVENIKVMLDSELEDPAEKERSLKISMTQTERDLINLLPEQIRFAVQELIRLTRTYTALDDIEHYQTTRLTLPFRRGLRALGEALQALGVVDDAMDVFFARAADLNEAVAADSREHWDRLAMKIREQKALYLEASQLSPRWELGKDETTVTITGGMNGLPGSPGVIEGPVYKVLSADDFAAFPQGAVLVARTTNPAWTPLFYKASAVVTESGGPLSHGAVTAREVGLPAVMSVRGVLSAVKNGQVIRVDGSAGKVLTEPN